jgi:hypothetical protein
MARCAVRSADRICGILLMLLLITIMVLNMIDSPGEPRSGFDYDYDYDYEHEHDYEHD